MVLISNLIPSPFVKILNFLVTNFVYILLPTSKVPNFYCFRWDSEVGDFGRTPRLPLTVKIVHFKSQAFQLEHCPTICQLKYLNRKRKVQVDQRVLPVPIANGIAKIESLDRMLNLSTFKIVSIRSSEGQMSSS